MKTNPKHRGAIAASVACWLVLSVGVSAAHAAGRSPVLSTPELLVDLARDTGLRCRGTQSEADVLRIRTLLRAALRLDARQERALVWLYELELRANRPEAAAGILEQLVKIDARNTTAFAAWLSAGSPNIQTVEQQKRWLEGLLAESAQPQNRALVHAHLAALALEQARKDDARRHVDESLRFWPECPDAAIMELRLASPDDPPTERLRVLLRAVRANPLQSDLSWETAILLDESELTGEAFVFYKHALDVDEKTAGEAAISSQKLFHFSRNALARGDRDTAVAFAKRAALAERREGGGYQAAFYWYWLLEHDSSDELLASVRAPMEQQFSAIKEPGKWPVTLVAQAAWYYCIIDEQPQRAVMLAESAARRASGHPFVTRVLGWAQSIAGRDAEAQETLIPIVKSDPYAAYMLARMLLIEGDEGAPARIAHQLERPPRVGRARALLDSIGGFTPASRPAQSSDSEISRILAEFNRDVLEFHHDPARFLEARIEMEDPSLAPGEPWRAVLSLTNRGGFPITLGADWMVNPVFLLSITLQGDRSRDFPDLIPISIDHSRLISPGETISVRRTIDVGPPRSASARTPQQMQSGTVSAILDPQLGSDGRWGPSATGQRVRGAAFARLPANTSREAWHARFAALKGESRSERFRALDVMAQLLAERQRARMKRLSYEPQEIPAARVHAALLSTLDSSSWETRFRTIEALQVAGLDQAMLDAVLKRLGDEHWAVRMAATRLLARQGAAFADQARRLADDDPDELVRDMARGFLMEWETKAAARPASQPTKP